MKVYDKAYYDYWYRERGFHDDEQLKGLVDAIAPVLEREIGVVGSILDVGCGEARWRAPLLERFSDASYTGLDPSAYCALRYGNERNIYRCSFREISGMKIGPFDFVMAFNVLEYISNDDLRIGLSAIRRLLSPTGIAFFFAMEGGEDGDTVDWHCRSHETYAKLYECAGFERVRKYRHFWRVRTDMDLPTAKP